MPARGWLQVRAAVEDEERVSAVLVVVKAKLPIATMANVLRAALRVGLDMVEADPRLVAERGGSDSPGPGRPRGRRSRDPATPTQ